MYNDLEPPYGRRAVDFDRLAIIEHVVFTWLRKRRRRRIVSRPCPTEWIEILRQDVPGFARLTDGEQSRLYDSTRIIAREKNWEGCGGLKLTKEMKVSISGQAALLTLGFDDQYFDHVQSILVYPGSYVVKDVVTNRGGLVIEGDSYREGEAWYGGPVILSWRDVVAGARWREDGRNLVLHEFAHQLDMLNDRTANGIPPLSSQSEFNRWTTMFNAEYQRLVHDCHHRQSRLFHCYGATNHAEFFAVASECFFEQPLEMQQHSEDLYNAFRGFYGQDPAARQGNE